MIYKHAIFLDIDGVLNHQEWYRKTPPKDRVDNFIDIDPEKVKMLNDMISSLGGNKSVAVICSSTWRLGNTLDELNYMFKKVGSTFNIVDKTPNSDHRFRGVEIKQWLMDNSEHYFGKIYYKFHSYAIIDDDSDMCLNQAEKFFRINSATGITYNDIHRIKNYLERYI